MAASGSKKVVYAALIGNGLIAISKFVASGLTGSSAMLSEGVHSVVDCGNQGLILLGMKRARKAPDAKHPFGYGMELYFWTFIVAIVIFGIGAGVSIYEGLERLSNPHAIESPTISYVVLCLALVFEGVAWWVAFKQFRLTKGERSWYGAVRHSKDPTVFTVLFEDSAAMIGLLLALAGTAASHLYGFHEADAIASIAIGVVLALTAALLAYESKGLLIGEAADQEVVAAIRGLFGGDGRVTAVNEVLTMHLGPEDILVAASLDFGDDLTAGDVETAITSFESRVKADHPHVRRIFIEAQGARASRAAQASAGMNVE